MFKLVWLVLCVFSLKVSGGQLGPLNCEILDGEVAITDCNWLAGGKLVITDRIDNSAVIIIGDAAFFDCWRLTSITIPEGVSGVMKFFKDS